MFQSDVVVFVSAGMLKPKKRDNILSRRQLYLNYGALSLATLVERNGYKTVLCHGEHDDPGDFFISLCNSGVFPSKYPLMLSIPSFYALPWAQEFCRVVRVNSPDCKIIVGGRWVVGGDIDWFKSLIPEVDVVVPGLGEPYILSLILERGGDLKRRVAPVPSYILNHRLIDGYQNYQPSIETSRGCGMGCFFCEERDIPIDNLKDPKLIVESLRVLQYQYNSVDIRPYFQSSMFIPSSAWAEALAKEVKNSDLKISWRTETRVDAMKPGTVALLAEAGLKVLDLGLEAASPAQIIAMGKSLKPDNYLRKAEDLLRACHKNGVQAKVNVLLYAGENSRTLTETRDWLDAQASNFRGVSVGPVVAYGSPKTANLFIKSLEKMEARPVNVDSSVKTGITHFHLSKEIDSITAEEISLDLSRRYMDLNDYFFLKKFSYYSRNYNKNDFDFDVGCSDVDFLPFRFY